MSDGQNPRVRTSSYSRRDTVVKVQQPAFGDSDSLQVTRGYNLKKTVRCLPLSPQDLGARPGTTNTLRNDAA